MVAELLRQYELYRSQFLIGTVLQQQLRRFFIHYTLFPSISHSIFSKKSVHLFFENLQKPRIYAISDFSYFKTNPRPTFLFHTFQTLVSSCCQGLPGRGNQGVCGCLPGGIRRTSPDAEDLSAD